MPLHSALVTTDLHIAGYIAGSDPGAVGAGILWFDTSTSPATLKKRNSGDSGWDGLQVQSATLASIADQTILGNVSGGSAAPIALTAAQVRTMLALVIGTNVQAFSAVLTALVSVMSSTATAAAQRTALGLGTSAVLATGTANGTVALNGFTVNQQSGTTYTFVTADANKRVEASNGSAQTYTVDTNANQPMTVGDMIQLVQMGTAQVTIAAAGGVTLISPGSLVKTRVRYSTICLVKQASDTWVLSGDLGS